MKMKRKNCLSNNTKKTNEKIRGREKPVFDTDKTFSSVNGMIERWKIFEKINTKREDMLFIGLIFDLPFSNWRVIESLNFFRRDRY